MYIYVNSYMLILISEIYLNWEYEIIGGKETRNREKFLPDSDDPRIVKTSSLAVKVNELESESRKDTIFYQ